MDEATGVRDGFKGSRYHAGIRLFYTPSGSMRYASADCAQTTNAATGLPEPATGGIVMPELYFKGKEFVYNHHLTVPFRPLVPDPAKSCGDDPDNLIIQGDNLQALKSLLPRYAGKVDLVFIDPPYNTGNEGWAYNDNVNSPLMKEWLDGNPVNSEDMLRHDKWLCMMWPRLKLLRELLSDEGSIWVCVDDNEVHRAQSLMDEIFGEDRFVALFVVENNRKGRNDKEHVSLTHEYMLVYSNDEYLSGGLELTEKQRAEFEFTEPDGRSYALRDLRKRGSEDRREDREPMYFPIYWDRESNTLSLHRERKSDVKILPHRGDGSDGRWRWGVKRVSENLSLLVPREGNGRFDIDYKVYLEGDDGEVSRRPKSVWVGPELSTDTSTREIKTLFDGKNPLKHAPKALEHVRRCIEIATRDDSIVLDSFAGSGTTAHAVLAQNAKDGGNRKFILVECEAYADSLTAERVRRAIEGYSYTGTQREDLLREKITFSKLKQANKLLDQVALVEKQNADRFDTIKSTVKDGELIVTGEKAVEKKTEGLGGGFTYCTLGDKLELDDLLTGKALPAFPAFGGYLFHTATGQPLDPAKVREADGYLGESAQYHVWLVYQPNLDFLKSRDAALTLTLAEKIAATDQAKPHLVFAPARFVPQKKLLELGVEHAPLPYALYRIERG